MSVSNYLSWLCREQANPVNVFIKSTDGVKGDTLPIVDAISYIGSHDTYDTISASVHTVRPEAIGKVKLSKADISAYRYLAIDVDSRTAHARKLCATDDERARTMATAEKVSAMLVAHGLPQPLQAMSGNGSLLLFPIDLPYTDANYKLLERFATILARIFNNEWVDIDEAVIKDPSRILGVIGTINRSKAEMPSEGRMAKERVVIGEYPPNEPMEADAFIEIVSELCVAHDALAEATADRLAYRAEHSAIGGWDFDVSESDAMARCKAYLEKCDDAIEGQGGHNATLRAACECYRFGLSDMQAKEMMEWYNSSKCQPSWTDGELRYKLASAKDKVIANGENGCRLRSGNEAQEDAGSAMPTRQPEAYPMTDVGNAEHFVAVYGENLRYIEAWKAWLVWDGKRWARDNTSKVRRMGIKMVRHTMLDYAKSVKDEDRRAKYLKWASMSQSGGKVDAMLSLASSLLACSPDALDANGNLFNVANGTLELDTLTFRPHRREDLLTKMSATVYEPNAKAGQWERFIHRIFQDENGKPRDEVIAYLQRAMGYAMTADTSEQCFFMLYGKGRNGKTTLLDAVKCVMGDYAMNALPSVLLRIGDGRQSMNSDDEADLQGRRLVSVSETDEGQRMDEAKVKRLVGNGRIRAMRKFEQSFEFEPSHKLFIDCNHKPKVKGDDDGIWRRIKLIPFTVQITADERDEHLGDKLAMEASGILNWILQGLRSWRADGLNEPKEISEAGGEYRSESDTFGLFLSDCIQPNDAERTAVAQVYAAYCRWSDDNGSMFKLTKIEFGKRMNGRGYETKKSNGKAYYLGCALVDEPKRMACTSAVDDDRPF